MFVLIRWEINGDPERCLQLLTADPRVDWNTRDPYGWTPLLYCLEEGDVETAEILIRNPRVDLNVAQQEDGWETAREDEEDAGEEDGGE